MAMTIFRGRWASLMVMAGLAVGCGSSPPLETPTASAAPNPPPVAAASKTETTSQDEQPVARKATAPETSQSLKPVEKEEKPEGVILPDPVDDSEKAGPKFPGLK